MNMQNKVFIRLTAYLFTIIFVVAAFPSIKAEAKTETVDYQDVMMAYGGAPVYAKPSISKNPIIRIPDFIPVNITGVTSNGFYRVELWGEYYVPTTYLVPYIMTEEQKKAKLLEQVTDIANAYSELLTNLESYSSNFELIDITGDGIPEILPNTGKEAYTYHDKHTVMVYYSELTMVNYYDPVTKTFLGRLWRNNLPIWEVYYKDTSILPWGQFKCCSYDATPYVLNAKEIKYKYTNDAGTRAKLYEMIKKSMGL